MIQKPDQLCSRSDLKGANVLIKNVKPSEEDPRGYVCKLADFGLARVLGSNCTHVSTSTHGGAPLLAVLHARQRMVRQAIWCRRTSSLCAQRGPSKAAFVRQDQLHVPARGAEHPAGLSGLCLLLCAALAGCVRLLLGGAEPWEPG